MAVLVILLIIMGIFGLLSFDGSLIIMGLLCLAMAYCMAAVGHYHAETNRLFDKSQCIIAHDNYERACAGYGPSEVAPFSFFGG